MVRPAPKHRTPARRGVVARQNDRHPAPLEVERQLVDLAELLLDLEPLVEFDMLQAATSSRFLRPD
jgi:hypothetical protein